MATSRIFTKEWDNIITKFKPLAHGMMKPGNFYKIVVYKYAADGKTRTLTGLSTSYIFLIGRFVDKKVKFPAIKLKHVNPELFFDALKPAIAQPITESEILDSANLEEFRILLRKFPSDGAPLYQILKRKPLVYTDNYREYKMTSIKSVDLITIDMEYLKDKLLPGSNTSKKIAERRENLTD
jgi:hypothetical protein